MSSFLSSCGAMNASLSIVFFAKKTQKNVTTLKIGNYHDSYIIKSSTLLDRLFPVLHCYNDSYYFPVLRIAPSSASQISFPATAWQTFDSCLLLSPLLLSFHQTIFSLMIILCTLFHSTWKIFYLFIPLSHFSCLHQLDYILQYWFCKFPSISIQMLYYFHKSFHIATTWKKSSNLTDIFECSSWCKNFD